MRATIAKIETMEEVLEGSTGQKIELTVDAEEQGIILKALQMYKGILWMKIMEAKEQPKIKIDIDVLRKATRGITE